MKSFSMRAAFFSLAVTGGLSLLASNPIARFPAGIDGGIELQLQSVKIDSLSRLSDADLKGVYVRTTFAGQPPVEFGKGQGWSLNRGESKDLNLKIDVKPAWIAQDSLEFKVELVREGSSNVLVRCAHVAKEVSTFDRGLQCTLPGETQPFLTYRLAKHDSAVPAAVASR